MKNEEWMGEKQKKKEERISSFFQTPSGIQVASHESMNVDIPASPHGRISSGFEQNGLTADLKWIRCPDPLADPLVSTLLLSGIVHFISFSIINCGDLLNIFHLIDASIIPLGTKGAVLLGSHSCLFLFFLGLSCNRTSHREITDFLTWSHSNLNILEYILLKLLFLSASAVLSFPLCWQRSATQKQAPTMATAPSNPRKGSND